MLSRGRFFIAFTLTVLVVLYALWQFDTVHVSLTTHVVNLTLDAQRHVSPSRTPLPP